MQVSLSSPVRAPARPGDGAGERLATGSLLLPLACLGLALLAFAGTVLGWILTHPEVGGWDQIGYGDEALRDLVALARGGLGALRDSLFLEARHHPPGHRLLALPLGLAGHADMTTLRFMAFGFSLLTAAVVGLVARRAAGTSAGLLAAAAFLMAPVSLFAAEEFLSETLLLPALAGLLWCLAREATGEGGWGNALLLGACLGAGALARLSFIPQVAPVLLAGLAVMLAGDRARLPRMLLAGTVAALIAWPFYAINGGRYIGYARFALTEWHSHQVKNDSPIGYLGNWLWFVADWAFGPFLAVALAGGALAALVLVGRAAWQARPRAAAGAGAWRWPDPALGIAAAALLLAAPPIAGHILATNHNPRFLLASLPGLAVAMAIGLHRLPWRGGRTTGLRIAMGLVAAQAVALALVARWPAAPPLAGLTSMQSRPGLACDWRPLAALLPGDEPKLLLLGQHDGFNEVQVAFAFHRQRRAVTTVNLRSRAPWDRIAAEAARADHVVALLAGDTRDIPYYRESFRPIPGGSEQRMNLVSEALLDRLGTEAGFTRRQAIEAPGGGGCRAVLLSR